MLKIMNENEPAQLKDIDLFKKISELSMRKAKGENDADLNKELRAYMASANERLRTTICADMLEDLAEYGFRKFEKEDWYMWDMEKCSDGSYPLHADIGIAEVLLNDTTIAIETYVEGEPDDEGESEDDTREYAKYFDGDPDRAVKEAKVVAKILKSTDNINELDSILTTKGYKRNN